MSLKWHIEGTLPRCQLAGEQATLDHKLGVLKVTADMDGVPPTDENKFKIRSCVDCLETLTDILRDTNYVNIRVTAPEMKGPGAWR